MIRIEYINAAGETVASVSHENEAMLVYEADSDDGDDGGTLVFTAESGAHLWVQPDAAVSPGEVYVPGGVMTWRIPCGAERTPYAPGAFASGRRLASARVMTEDEIKARRNVAANPADLRGDTDFFPHITANVETRGEAIFAARNAIDGCRCNSGHWGWPYQSWGIGGRADAFCTVDFGREVEVDEAAITIRADFPHDTFWREATLTFSDGETLTFALRKTADRQFIRFGRRRVRWVRLGNLIQDENTEGFPALTELEIYGRDI